MKNILVAILFTGLSASGLMAQAAPVEKKCFLYDGDDEVIYITLEIVGQDLRGQVSSRSKTGGNPRFPSSMIKEGIYDGVRLTFKSFPSREEITKYGNDRDVQRIWILMNDKITIPGVDGGKTFVLNKIGC